MENNNGTSDIEIKNIEVLQNGTNIPYWFTEEGHIHFNADGKYGEITVRYDVVKPYLTTPQPDTSNAADILRISHFQNHDILKGNGADAFWYQFCASKPIDRSINQKLIEAIEAALEESYQIWKNRADHFNEKYNEQLYEINRLQEEIRNYEASAGKSM